MDKPMVSTISPTATRETANPALQLATEREQFARHIAAAAGCRKRINGLKARLRAKEART